MFIYIIKLFVLGAVIVTVLFLILAPPLMKFVGHEKDGQKTEFGIKSIWRYIKTGEKDPENPFLK